MRRGGWLGRVRWVGAGFIDLRVIEGANHQMRKLLIMLAAALVASMIAMSVTAATHTFAPLALRQIEISGRIRDGRGKPVAALKISLRNWFGVDLASAVTDQNGIYHLNVAPGRYYVNFRPLAENSRGETIIIDVPAHFLLMNLTVTRNPPAIARANDLAIPLA